MRSRETASWKIIAVILVRDDVSSNSVVVVEMEKSRQILIHFGVKIWET